VRHALALTSPVMRRRSSREAREWGSTHKRADAATTCSVELTTADGFAEMLDHRGSSTHLRTCRVK
jgi:hypothetical protein